jgi:hypothetical protein
MHSAHAVDVPSDSITNTFNSSKTRNNLFIADSFLSWSACLALNEI